MNTERAIKLLGADLSTSQVATILGVSPGRISQLLLNPEFKERVDAEKTINQANDIEKINLDAKYNAVEHAVLNCIQDNLPAAEFRDAVAALRVISDRQQKARTYVNPAMESASIINNIVQIAIPSHVLPQVAYSDTREVISIGDRTLAPLSSKGVINLFKTIDNEKDIPNGHQTVIPSAETSSAESIPEKPAAEVTSNLIGAAKSFLNNFANRGKELARA